MAQRPSLNKPWRILMTKGMYAQLHTHLFPGDRDEHGAVILAGLAETEHDVRLLVRELHLAKDGCDYVQGKRGYRMLRAEFITGQVMKARDERLVYLAVHNHGGTDRVAFSSDDLRSHERGYPALLQITRGGPVGALVFAKNAVAGDIWLSDRSRVSLAGATIIGPRRQLLEPRRLPPSLQQPDPRYDRQVRLFGDRGQKILGKAKVAIVGLGGVGSLLAEYLGRLGVGHFVLIDPDRVESTNLPRLVGATRWDAAPRIFEATSAGWIKAVGRLLARSKVHLARRNIRRANPDASVKTLATDFVESNVPDHLTDCDYIFLAADTMRARLLFNAIVHQYLIPGVQIGAKVISDNTGAVCDVYAVARPVAPGSGCLWCNGLINSSKLQEESLSDEERRAQQYVDEPEIVAPSVITLNALAAAQAANDFMFYMIGLAAEDTTLDYMRFRPSRREVWWDEPRSDIDCVDCGRSERSRFARGDGQRLPVKYRRAA